MLRAACARGLRAARGAAGGRRRGFWSEAPAENTGSTARDHLANERTFLAWARTGLGFVGSGLAFFYASTENPQRVKQIRSSNILPATALLVGNGLLFLGFATVRYFAAMRHLRDGKFPINSRGVVLMILTTGVSSLGSLYLIVHDRLERGDDTIIHELGLDAPQQLAHHLARHLRHGAPPAAEAAQPPAEDVKVDKRGPAVPQP